MSGTTKAVLRLEGITKRFGPLVANDAIDLVLHEGEVLALLGENGAGKTTLMNILFGHYVVGHPWSVLLADYNIFRGRVWPLVLLAVLVAPLIAGKFARPKR